MYKYKSIQEVVNAKIPTVRKTYYVLEELRLREEKKEEEES